MHTHDQARPNSPRKWHVTHEAGTKGHHMAPYKIDFESAPWQTPAAGVRAKVHDQQGKRLRLVEFTREFIETDWCRKSHTGYVLEGELEIDFSGEVVVFHAGDGLFIPAGEENKHKAKVLTDAVRLILVEET